MTCFLILLDSLCWFLQSNKTAISLSLESVALGWRWTLSFKLTLALGCLLNLCDYPSSLVYFSWLFRVGQHPSVFQKGLSQHLDSGWLEARSLGSSFQRMQMYTAQWDCKYKPCWPPDQMIWRYPLGDSHKNWGSRWVYKRFSGRYQRDVMRQRESERWRPLASIPRSTCSLWMCA